MKKRVISIVAGAVVLVALCAGLPKLTAMLMDKQAENTPVFNDIRPVEQTTDTDTLSMLDRLWLYGNGKSVDVNGANATKTENEIKKCVETFLYPCRAAGIYQGVTFPSPTLTAKLIYDVDDPSRSMIVWEYYAVKFQTTIDGQQLGEMRTINVIVDDETGKILSVLFDHYNVSYSQNDIWQRNKKRVEPLAELYFAQLELTELAQAAEASPEKYSFLEEQGENETEVHYILEEPDCGVKLIFAASGLDAFRVSVEKTKT